MMENGANIIESKKYLKSKKKTIFNAAEILMQEVMRNKLLFRSNL